MAAPSIVGVHTGFWVLPLTFGRGMPPAWGGSVLLHHVGSISTCQGLSAEDNLFLVLLLLSVSRLLSDSGGAMFRTSWRGLLQWK